MTQRKITFIGGGNMATAIISGLIASGYDKKSITVAVPSEASQTRIAAQFGVITTSNNIGAVKDADVVVLSVKPQIMKSVCLALKDHIDIEKQLFLTIAAGTPVQLYQDTLGAAVKLIRVMPNTPSLVGEGVSGLYADAEVTVDDKSFAAYLMSAVGKVVWVQHEHEINHIIALSGSAPGYFFLFLEAIQDKAEKLGFSSQQAREVILQTAKGIVALAEHDQEISFGQLRQNVMSKGGTTVEALSVFEKHQFKQIVDEAMQAAIRRAQEMEVELLKQ